MYGYRSPAYALRRRSITGLTALVLLAALLACSGPGAGPSAARLSEPVPAHDAAGSDRDSDCSHEAPTLTCVATADRLNVRVRNSRIWLSDSVAVDATFLSATLVPAHTAQTVVLDDLHSFSVAVHQARLHLDGKALQALVAPRLAEDPGIRDVHIRLAGPDLIVTGQFQRRGWVAFTLRGPLTRGDDARHLVLRPARVTVDGRAARGLMQAAHLQLADILSLSAPGITIDGDDIVIDVPALLSAPRIELAMDHAEVVDGRLALRLDDGQVPTALQPARPATSYVLLNGGRLAIGPLQLADPRIQLGPAQAHGRLSLSLHGYRSQLARRPIRLLPGPGHRTFVAALPAWAPS